MNVTVGTWGRCCITKLIKGVFVLFNMFVIRTLLVGKAQEIYGSLSVEQSSNYEHVKEAILKAYELVPEAYRQKFRNYLKYDIKTHVEFARERRTYSIDGVILRR